jgi:hypothetical protein
MLQDDIYEGDCGCGVVVVLMGFRVSKAGVSVAAVDSTEEM